MKLNKKTYAAEILRLFLRNRYFLETEKKIQQ